MGPGERADRADSADRSGGSGCTGGRGRLVDAVVHGRDPGRGQRRAGPRTGGRRTLRVPRSTPPPGGTPCRRRWSRPADCPMWTPSRWPGSSTAWSAWTPTGEVVRPALLWNDTRSAGAADDLVAELGAKEWAEAIGSVPVASFTATKLRWLARHEPEHAAATAAVCLPHDWLTWRLRGTGDLDDLVTDRSDASGTGYWSGGHRRVPARPARTRLRPRRRAAAPGARTRARGRPHPRRRRCSARARATTRAPRWGWAPGRATWSISLGTSGVVSAVSTTATADPTGIIAGFASATGEHLPLVCTLNAARVLDAAARILGVDHAELARLALSAPAGADGLVLVPYLEGERTPNRPDATGRAARADARHLDARRTWPGPLWRGCCAGWPTRWTRWSRPGYRCGGRSWSAGRPVRRRWPGSRRRSSAARCCCPRPASTWPTAPRGRRPGCWPGPDGPPAVGRGRHRRVRGRRRRRRCASATRRSAT